MEGNKKLLVLLSSLLVAFMTMACSYVGPDANDEPASSLKGLTTQQIVEGMEIKANVTSSSRAVEDESENPEISVTWACPIFFTNWSITYKVAGDTDEDTWHPVSSSVSCERSDVDTDVYKYSFKHCPIFSTTEYIVYYKVSMQDHNGAWYSNIVSFMVYPKNRQLRITLSDETDAGAPSTLYGLWASNCVLFPSIHEIFDNDNIPATKDVSLAAYSPVIFAIETDFSYMNWSGIDMVIHVSNSSYCKAIKVETPSDAEARIKYSFEDLPITRLWAEPEGSFDYNDVVFFVDVLEP